VAPGLLTRCRCRGRGRRAAAEQRRRQPRPAPTARPRSPTCAGSHRSPPAAAKTRRHRLNRGGGRGANNALYTVVLTRIRCDPCTRRYLDRRTSKGEQARDHPLLQALPGPRELPGPGHSLPVLVVPAASSTAAGGSTLKTPKARAAGLRHPLRSMTINADEDTTTNDLPLDRT